MISMNTLQNNYSCFACQRLFTRLWQDIYQFSIGPSQLYIYANINSSMWRFIGNVIMHDHELENDTAKPLASL